MSLIRYTDRVAAGKRLAGDLHYLQTGSDIVVYGLVGGGMVVAEEIARALSGQLDLLVVHRLMVPDRPGWSMGAVAAGGDAVLHEEVVNRFGISSGTIGLLEEEELRRIYARDKDLRDGRAPVNPHGSVAVVVDDGIADSTKLHAACRALRRKHPHALIAATPVGSPDDVRELSHVVDRVVCPLQPTRVGAIESWYELFPDITDEEARRRLHEYRHLTLTASHA